MRKINANIVLVGGVILGGILVWFFFPNPQITPQKIGDYPAKKQANWTLVTSNRTIYKVNPFAQTITYWMPGIDEAPKRIVQCNIRDIKNWIGWHPDGSGLVEMRGGMVMTGDPNDIYAGPWQWHLSEFEIP